MRDTRRILVLGAGATGLGAAWHLQEIGWDRWQVLEAADAPGGLGASVVDDAGFTWDLGGHVLFSHYAYFDRLMDELLGADWVQHVRESWIFMRGRFIPYPLQNNIWRLPADDLIRCLEGLLEVHEARDTIPPANFEEWILRTFGQGLAEVFLLPYNRKVWGYDPGSLGTGWMGERVATVDLRRALRNLVLRQDDCGWGPNHRFRYPLRGGTGAIWRALYDRIPRGRVSFGERVVQVATADRTVRCADGSTHPYEALISALPLDYLLSCFTDRRDLAALGRRFLHSSVHIIGVGLAGTVPEGLATKNWIYFPEPSVPFYRVTVFSNYSPHNVPEPGRQWSLLCEVSESRLKPVDSGRIGDEVVSGLRQVGFLDAEARIVTLWHRRLEYGYPTPFLQRDEVLEAVDPELQRLGIWSRGRFGAWKYEVSNQDHSLMMGVEAVDHIIFNAEEVTYHYPGRVNAGPRWTLENRPLVDGSKPATTG